MAHPRVVAVFARVGIHLHLPPLELSATLHLRHLASSRFNGVDWDSSRQRFRARVTFNYKAHFAGYHLCQEEAAQAHDRCLRALCSNGVRLKRSLNFPTSLEASYSETNQQARTRSLAAHADKADKEEESFDRLQKRLHLSHAASAYEILQVPGFSRADAIFQAKGSTTGGVSLQLKSSSRHGNAYMFSSTRGYDGMLLILVALCSDLIWVVPGALITQTSLKIRIGSSRDKEWRVEDIGAYMKSCISLPLQFPRITVAEAGLQCGGRHRIEERAHRCLFQLLSGSELQLRKARKVSCPVDSVLTAEGVQWRVQEKTRSYRESGRYSVSLSRYAGALGAAAYAKTDFDLLLASILDKEQLSGLFAFPVNILVRRGYVGVGQKAKFLPLHPPWALPAREATKIKYAWQLGYFVDLRDWRAEDAVPQQLQGLIGQLLREVCAHEKPSSHMFMRVALGVGVHEDP